VRTRHLAKLPSREEKVSPEDLQVRMTGLVAPLFPGRYGLKEGRALTALGAIPAPVDTVAQRRARIRVGKRPPTGASTVADSDMVAARLRDSC
jgi:hypothetical protein